MPDLRYLPAHGRRMNEAMLWALKMEFPGEIARTDGEALRGTPASPGSYTGRVRVVRGEADFGTLLPGEVLVCPTASPSWTILFAVAGALVTDGGGPLSHAAIVAREHGLPAVVGTVHATTHLGTVRSSPSTAPPGPSRSIRRTDHPLRRLPRRHQPMTPTTPALHKGLQQSLTWGRNDGAQDYPATSGDLGAHRKL